MKRRVILSAILMRQLSRRNRRWLRTFRRCAENIAKALKISEDQINVKATTEEGLGFTGEGAGISSQAICLLEEIGDFGGRDVMYETSYDPSAGGCAGCGGCKR